MTESFEHIGSSHITDEQVVEALRAQNTDAQATFERWYQSLNDEMDEIYMAQGPEAMPQASIKCALRRAVVYYKAGFAKEAIADLVETCDGANSPMFDGTGLYEEAVQLLDRMRKGDTL